MPNTSSHSETRAEITKEHEAPPSGQTGSRRLSLLPWTVFFIAFALLTATALCLEPETTVESEQDPPAAAQEGETSDALAKGKDRLLGREYENAIVLLTKAYNDLPVLGDYALLWRSEAREGCGDLSAALADLAAVREKYPHSPLIKKVRRREIDLRDKRKDQSLMAALRDFVRDYPSEPDMKYRYATLLKGSGETQKARKLFKELFASPSPFSERAARDLSPADITAEDLLRRARNLNEAWLFPEAERCFRSALDKDDGGLKTEIEEGLAYSLFRQKRYREAAELYRKTNSRYWYARSLLRAGELSAFEAELPVLKQLPDKRIASVLISYGNRKRREGDIEKALAVFRDTLARFPSAREDALWAIGWTYFRSGEYQRATKTFSELHETFGGSQYLYWKNRCAGLLGEGESAKVSLRKQGVTHRDFYAFLGMLKENQRLPALRKSSSKVSARTLPPGRAGLLIKLGLEDEAVIELVSLSRKNPEPAQILLIGSELNRLGNFKTAVNLIAKAPYDESLHELLYPLAYWSEVHEGAKRADIDPLLVLSVIREESRYDPEARSVAGAMGLMQLMPQTAERFGRKLHTDMRQPDKLCDPKSNVLIGSHYLKQLIMTLESLPVALAAYNAGEEAVRAWLKKERYATVDEFIEDIPYDETRNYVKKVITTYFEYLRGNGTLDASGARKSIGNL